MGDTDVHTVPEQVRRDVIDYLTLGGFAWNGRLDDVDFLKRLYDVSAMASSDPRFDNASSDIWQHRVNNWDWSSDWVFDDTRFDLIHAPDEQFLRFACEVLHPVVRQDAKRKLCAVGLCCGNAPCTGLSSLR